MDGTTKHAFEVALDTCMDQIGNTITSRTGGGVTYDDINLWYDVIDMYFAEMP